MCYSHRIKFLSGGYQAKSSIAYKKMKRKREFSPLPCEHQFQQIHPQSGRTPDTEQPGGSLDVHKRNFTSKVFLGRGILESWQSLSEAPLWTGQGNLRDALRKGSPKAIWGFSGGSDGKASLCSAGDQGSIPGLGRSPGEGNGSPLQYSCLENPMDGGAWWATVHGVANSRIWLSDFTFHFQGHLENLSIPGNQAIPSIVLLWPIKLSLLPPLHPPTEGPRKKLLLLSSQPPRHPKWGRWHGVVDTVGEGGWGELGD